MFSHASSQPTPHQDHLHMDQIVHPNNIAIDYLKYEYIKDYAQAY
jgi:hypothetical protein